jgi:hypothetical protein
MPYPWFQNQVKAGLYGRTQFPNADFEGVSTNKQHVGYSALLLQFLDANVDYYEGHDGQGPGIYIDLGGVNDMFLEDGTFFRDARYTNHPPFTFEPYGLAFRIRRGGSPLTMPKKTNPIVGTRLLTLGLEGLDQLQNSKFGQHLPPVSKFPEGTWEFGARSLYNDAQYQTGLAFLGYGLGMQTSGMDTVEELTVYSELLCASSDVLDGTLAELDRAVGLSRAISSSLNDVVKNTLLACARCSGAQTVMASLAASGEFNKLNNNKGLRKRHNDASNNGEEVVVEDTTLLSYAEEAEQRGDQMVTLARRFLAERPDDRDAEAFRTLAQQHLDKKEGPKREQVIM